MKICFTLIWLVLAVGCRDQSSQPIRESASDAVIQQELSLKHAQSGSDISYLPDTELSDQNWIGVVLPSNSVDIVANTGGLLTISARVGDLIRRGSVLARVDNVSAEEELQMEEHKLQALEAELEQAGFDAEKEQSMYNRRVTHPDAISKDELDRSESSAKAAEARWKVTQANVEEQQIRVEQYRQNILAQSVGSPFAGTVVMHYLDSGSVVLPGVAIMRISTSNTFMIRFAIEPDQAELLSIGDRVQIITGSKSIPAEVMSIAPFVDIPSQKIFAEAFPLEQDRMLRTGLGVEVAVAQDGVEDFTSAF